MRASADPANAPDMAAYMKDKFSFLGLASPDRRRITKELIGAAEHADAAELRELAHRAWLMEEREFQYVGTDLLRAGAHNLGAGDLAAVRALIESKSWWDTVDLLAAWVVGPLVADNPDLAVDMDLWIDDPDIWVARAAILHQLGYKDRTDATRLFRYAEKRAGDAEFFTRKALGWALRQYAREDPEAVRHFVDQHEHELAGLTKREALKHLSR